MSTPEAKTQNEVTVLDGIVTDTVSPAGLDLFRRPFSTILPIDRLRAWAVRGGSSVLQQGLFAGSHFLANVLLARWMTPEAYGAFALAYSFYLLLLAVYMALVYEPLLVYGSGRYETSFPAYVGVLSRGHFVLLLPASLVVVAVAPAIGHFYSHSFQAAFAALAVASPFLLLMWLFRGVFYARLNAYAGTLAGACYFAILLLSLLALRRLQLLSPATALEGMALSSFVVSLGCWYWFHVSRSATREQSVVSSGRVLADHWRYGRWAALTAIVAWIPANIYYALLPSRFGLEGTATLRAMMNLMYPLLHSFSALLTLLIPILVRQRSRHGVQRSKQTTLQLISIYVPAGILYLLLVIGFRAPILRFLYSDRYANVPFAAVLFVAMLPITTGVIGLLGAALRSFELPHLVFRGYFASSIIAVLVGIPLTFHFGVSGAAAAIVLNDLPGIAVLAICLLRYKKSAGAQA